MPDYTISITDNEKKCLDTVMVGIGTWAANGLQNRAHRAQEKILNDLFKHCNANGIALATGASAQIDQAYDLGLIAKAVEEEYKAPGE